LNLTEKSHKLSFELEYKLVEKTLKWLQTCQDSLENDKL